MLEYLEREDLVVKEDKRYRVTDWERLLRAWSADASFQTTTRAMAFIDPRGADNRLAKIGPNVAPASLGTRPSCHSQPRLE